MSQLLDRNISQIAFYRRVFEEARDERNPLLERVKFLGILGGSADDFIASSDGTKPELNALLTDARAYLRAELQPRLAAYGIDLLPYSSLTDKDRAEADRHFAASVEPLLLPLGFDAARPFPHIAGRALAMAVRICRNDGEHFACVEIPHSLPSLVALDGDRGRRFVWLHEIVAANLVAIFPGATSLECFPFRIVRDNRIAPAPRDGRTLREAMELGLLEREFGAVRSIVVDGKMPRALANFLAAHLDFDPAAVEVSPDLVDLSRLTELAHIDADELRDRALAPKRRPRVVFDELRSGDILLHHPFDSFQTVVDFIEQAASDPDVLSISTTLYRAGKDSPIVESLLSAQRAGKQVRVVIELRARLDEAHNLAWGYALEQAGAHVAYGTVAFKVHAKMTLIVRREGRGLQRYLHLSSGNYNTATSMHYTDLGLLTARADVCADAAELFNALSGVGFPSGFRTLLVAPITLRRGIAALISREARWAAEGHRAHMILKMNALADADIIDALYKASQAGTRIDLIVRGICLLQPGLPGVSHNISVRSIVGRFLEHSRAWYFRNGGQEEVYVGSADLMPRNLEDRIEVMVPLEDEVLKRRVKRGILDVYLADNVKARELLADGRYVRSMGAPEQPSVNSQECFQ